MPPRYGLTIMSPDRIIYRGRVESLVAPGVEGYFGVLARHAPMVAELGVGELGVVAEQGQPSGAGAKWPAARSAAERAAFAVAGGILEVQRDGVTILADAAEPVQEIEVTRAQAAQARAEARLRSRGSDVDLVRAQAALQRALNRLRVAHKWQRGDS